MVSGVSGKSFQFDAYRLDRFEATLRPSLVIEDKTINGVRLRELDRKMQEVDWLAHFSLVAPVQLDIIDPIIIELRDDLLKPE